MNTSVFPYYFYSSLIFLWYFSIYPLFSSLHIIRSSCRLPSTPELGRNIVYYNISILSFMTIDKPRHAHFARMIQVTWKDHAENRSGTAIVYVQYKSPSTLCLPLNSSPTPPTNSCAVSWTNTTQISYKSSPILYYFNQKMISYGTTMIKKFIHYMMYTCMQIYYSKKETINISTCWSGFWIKVP